MYSDIHIYARIITYPPQKIAGVSQIAKCKREQLGPAKLLTSPYQIEQMRDDQVPYQMTSN